MSETEEALQYLAQTIQRLNETPLLSHQDEYEKNYLFMRKVSSRMFDEGITHGKAAGGMEHLNQSEPTFRQTIKDTNNNLMWQLSVINESLDKWFNHGYSLPPYYPMRVAIILSKNRMKDKEAEFLRAYLRHFRGGIGTTEMKLDERADKLGIKFDDGAIKARNTARMNYLRQKRQDTNFSIDWLAQME